LLFVTQFLIIVAVKLEFVPTGTRQKLDASGRIWAVKKTLDIVSKRSST
jgi:hypothetical protein